MRNLKFIEYRHPTLGFTLPVPPDWERTEDAQEGVALVAVEPPGDVPFRANLVVTVERLPDGMGLEQWQDASDEMLPEQLPNYQLIDREFVSADPYHTVRRVGHYAADNTGSVTMQQWAQEKDGFGYTLTTSVATLAFDSLADMFVDVAAQFRPGTLPPEVS